MTSLNGFRFHLAIGALLVPFMHACPAFALDGGILRLNTFNDWKAFEVISQNDNPPGDGFSYAMPGIFDGAGAWLVDPFTLRVLVNHETGDATISEVDLDLPALQMAVDSVLSTGNSGGIRFVFSARQAYDRWSADGGASWVGTSSAANTSFFRFCSGQSYAPDTYGVDRGFVDHIYITGEETGGGRLFAVDSVKRDFYQLSGTVGSATGGIGGMPFDAWENAALLDTGETDHVALLLSPDGGTRTMQLYIGEKGRDANGAVSNSFLARNGLAYGSWYYLNAAYPNLGNTNSGTFDTTAVGALSSDKLEDIDTSPADPSRAILADETSGVFTFDFDLVFNSGFDADASGFAITMVSNTSGGANSLNGPDNIEWSDATSFGAINYSEGLVFVNEDTSSGEIWQMQPDGSEQILIANTTVAAESTGILDISSLLGYLPASILITNNQGFPSSMSVLINPAASVAAPPVDELAECRLENDLLRDENEALRIQVDELVSDNQSCNVSLDQALGEKERLATDNKALNTNIEKLRAEIDALKSTLDSDADGVPDISDQCPDTFRWARKIDAEGCARYQRAWSRFLQARLDGPGTVHRGYQ
ncbi:MAG: hypothetical protein WBN40_13715 [Pseudomonadales bacterium]